MIDLSPEAWSLRVSHAVPQLTSLAPIRFSQGFQKQLIRVLVESESTPAKKVNPLWRRGGFINQFYEDIELGTRRVPLHVSKILVLSNLGDQPYQIAFKPIGLYLPNYRFFVWEYRGDVPNNITSEGFAAYPDARIDDPEWNWQDSLP